MAFYTVSSFVDGTFIEIFIDGELSEAMVLMEFETYTTSTDLTTVDLTGHFIRSRYPVSVINGVVCVADEANGAYISNSPSVEKFGQASLYDNVTIMLMNITSNNSNYINGLV